MKMAQTWGWLAAGVLAAGLNATYHDGGFPWAHRVADRVADRVEEARTTVRDLASGRADIFLAEARLFLSHDDDPSAVWSSKLARVEKRADSVQTKVARAESRIKAHSEMMSDRHEAALDLADARRERVEALVEANQARIEALIRSRVGRANQVRVSFAPVVFNPPQPPVCPRVRMDLERMPAIKIPSVHVEMNADPI